MGSPEISVQLYSVHKALEADLDGTLRCLADIGLRHVEAFDFVRRVDVLKTSLARHGLNAPTAHAVLIEDTVDTPDGLLTVPSPEDTFAAAAELGVSMVIDPFVPATRWAAVEDVQRNADLLNQRAAQAAPYGLRVGYHNHDHELTSIIDGRTALEVFTEFLDPAVALEVDLYWVTASGQDPVDLLRRLGDRVEAVHIKDGPMRPGISAADLPSDQVPAGEGDVPLAAALAAGGNIAYAVIEFDHYAGDVFDGVAGSFGFLTATVEG
jgi:sugar phosphate isomerase/epimerase